MRTRKWGKYFNCWMLNFEFSTMRKQFFIFYGFFASTTFLPWERIFAIHFTFYSNFMTSSTIFFHDPPNSSNVGRRMIFNVNTFMGIKESQRNFSSCVGVEFDFMICCVTRITLRHSTWLTRESEVNFYDFLMRLLFLLHAHVRWWWDVFNNKTDKREPCVHFWQFERWDCGIYLLFVMNEI